MRLAELRQAQNLSQKELATIIGCSQNLISQWENETRDPSTKMLISLANYFNVSIGYLLGIEETSTQKEIRNEISSWLEYYRDDPEAVSCINEMLAIVPQLNKESTLRVKAYLSDIFSNPKNLKGAEIKDETEAQKGDTYESR